MAGHTVPRQLLDDANNAVEKLKRKLEEATVAGRKEMDAALESVTLQLKTLQAQQRSSEEQLNRSMNREKELRQAAAESNLYITKLRNENEVLRDTIEDLNQNLEKSRSKESEVIVMRANIENLEKAQECARMRYQEEIEELKEDFEKRLREGQASEQVQTRVAAENLSKSEAIVVSLKSDVKTLKESLAQAQSMIVASETNAAKLAEEILRLQAELAVNRKSMVEQQANSQALQSTVEMLQTKLCEMESALSAEQMVTVQLTNKLQEAQEALLALENSSKSASEAAQCEINRMAEQVVEVTRKLGEAASEMKRSESDSKGIRDQLREELRRTEAENKQLRESLRQEHDRLEREIKEHSHSMEEQLQQRQRSEMAATKREEALQKRLQNVELELDSLRGSSVPEIQLRNLQEEIRVERQQYANKIQQGQDEMKAMDDHFRALIARLEQRASDAEDSTHDKSSTIRSLEKKLREAEKLAALERKQRHHAAEQVKYLTGDPNLTLKNDNPNPTKMAEAALAVIDSTQDSCEKSVLKIMSQEQWKDSVGVQSQHRTALGIILNETRVDATIPGSPAFTCGQIERLDEILMVDGQRVNAETAMSALRGDDSIGGVASILLRKASSGEVLVVNIPRIDIATVKLRQDVNDGMNTLFNEAALAAKSSDPSLLLDRLEKITEQVQMLDRLNLNVQQRLSAQVATLREGLEDAISKGKAAVLDVDATHQQVHMLQSLTEAELREYLAGIDDDDEDEQQKNKEITLHKHIQELEGDLKALQEELSATQMLRREALEQAENLRLKEQEMCEQVILFQQGQKSMRESIATLEDQLAEAVADILDHPFAIGIRVDRDFESTMKDSESRHSFDSQLRDDIATALQIPKSLVNIMSFHRGSVVAEVKLSSVVPTSGVTSDGLRTGKMLAVEVARQVDDPTAPIHEGLLGSRIISAEVHGPISEMTSKAFKASIIDKERELLRKEDEIRRLHDKINDVQAQGRAALDAMNKENKAQLANAEEKLQRLLRERKVEVARLMEQEKQRMMAEQGSSKEKLAKKLESEKDVLQQEHKRLQGELLQTIAQKEAESEILKDRIYNLEVAISNTSHEARTSHEALSCAREELMKLKKKCNQVEEMLVAELKTSVINLNNVESEMGFFHAYHMRAMSIASSFGNNSSTSSVKDDVTRSKEMVQMMQRDIQMLRSQLEALTTFSYSDPFLLSEQLAESVAFASNRAYPPAGTLSGVGLNKSSISPIHEGTKSPFDQTRLSPEPRQLTTSGSMLLAQSDATKMLPKVQAIDRSSGLSDSVNLRLQFGQAGSKSLVHNESMKTDNSSTFHDRSRLKLENTKDSALEEQPNRKSTSKDSTFEEKRNRNSTSETLDMGQSQGSFLVTATPNSAIPQKLMIPAVPNIGEIRINIKEARDLPCPSSGVQDQEYFVCVSIFHHLTQMEFVSHRIDSFQDRMEQDSLTNKRGNQIFRFKPQYRTQTKICTSHPKWDEQMHTLEMHTLLPVIQDDEKRMNTWFLRSTMMTKIEGKPVAVLVTLHGSTDSFGSHPLGRLHLVLRPGTESSEWHDLCTEEGCALIGDQGRVSSIQLEVFHTESASRLS